MDINERVRIIEIDLKSQNNMIIRIDTTLEEVCTQIENLVISVNSLLQDLSKRMGQVETRVTAIEIALKERCSKRQEEIKIISHQLSNIKLNQAKFAGVCAACSALGASFPFIFNYILKI